MGSGIHFRTVCVKDCGFYYRLARIYYRLHHIYYRHFKYIINFHIYIINSISYPELNPVQ